ncbi:MAG: hypothetical protein M4D80_12015 [Myxococcota bacterium]|nr:hypothetical protein [Myxococcota bacterium]
MRRLIVLLGLVGCASPDTDRRGEPWTERTALPDRRLEASATGVGARLVVIGGFVNESLEISRDVLQYDPFRDEWSVHPLQAPEAFTHAALTSVGGSLYLLGGLEGSAFTPSGKSWRLRPNATTWEALADMPIGHERGAAAVVVSTGHIFLLGGEIAGGFTDTILDYEISSNTWSVHPMKLTTARSHAAAMREDDGTFIIAGGNGIQGPLGDTFALRLDGMVELRAPMNIARGGCAYGVIFGQLVCAGGEIGTAVSRVVEVYDPTDDEWTVPTIGGRWLAAIAEMPLERAGAAGAIVTSRLYVVGGSQTNALTPTNTLYEFDLLDTLPR